MAYVTEQLYWQESMNGVTIDCSLDIAVHPASTSTIILTIPGVDGSMNGYEDKYVRMVEGMQQVHNVAAVRVANPFITSFHWESNPRRAIDYITNNTAKITGGSRAATH